MSLEGEALVSKPEIISGAMYKSVPEELSAPVCRRLFLIKPDIPKSINFKP